RASPRLSPLPCTALFRSTLWLVLATHPLLDAMTAYGTQLLWPLTPTPTAWSSLFIIDPFYTLPLFATVTAALIMGMRPALTRTLDRKSTRLNSSHVKSSY